MFFGVELRQTVGADLIEMLGCRCHDLLQMLAEIDDCLVRDLRPALFVKAPQSGLTEKPQLSADGINASNLGGGAGDFDELTVVELKQFGFRAGIEFVVDDGYGEQRMFRFDFKAGFLQVDIV